MQYLNVFMNRLFRKEIKDKHKIVIEKLKRHSVYSNPTLSYSMQPFEHLFVQIKCLC